MADGGDCTDPNSGVAWFPGLTLADIPAERVLEAAKAHVETVVVIGRAQSGELYLASTTSDLRDVLWDVERARHTIMTLADDNETDD